MAGVDLPEDKCDELAFMTLERDATVELAKRETSQQRLVHMLTKNKPLKN